MNRIFISVIMLLGAVLIGVLSLVPEWERFQALRGEVAALEEISGEFDELIANRDALLTLINTISKENLARIDRMLPVGPGASDFLVSMEALTVQNGVALRRIDLVSPEKEKAAAPKARGETGADGAAPGQPRPAAAASASSAAAGPKALPFNVQIGASYASFKKFLQALERNIRIIDVEDISFSASGKGEISDFTLKAKTYYQ